MSAPNKSYDPVQVTALERRRGRARPRRQRSPPSRPPPTSTRCKAVRLAHAGDRSPLALANREIGALPPAAKAEAGKRVGTARRAVTEALAARQERARGERDERVLVEEAVDVTLPWDRVAARRPAPADHPHGADRRRVRRDGLRGRRRPRGRGRVVQLRRAEHAARTTPRAPCRTRSSSSPPGLRRRAAHPHLAGADPHACCAASRRSTWSARAGSTAPTSWTRRTRRCSTRSRGWSSTRASRWRT